MGQAGVRTPMGGDPTPPPLVLDVIGRLMSEPHVLDAWSRDTGHERLAAAYQALYGRAVARAAEMAASLSATFPEARALLVAEAERHQQEATAIRMELSRLKWLLVGRRTRLSIDGLPAYPPHREAESREVEDLEQLIADLHSVLC